MQIVTLYKRLPEVGKMLYRIQKIKNLDFDCKILKTEITIAN